MLLLMTHESAVAWRRISHKCTKELLLEGMSFLLVGKKREKKNMSTTKRCLRTHTQCGCTMPLLTTFLQEIIHQTGTPWATRPFYVAILPKTN